MSWPDGGATPFRGEKAANWEGAFRVPCVIRWPGVIKPGSVVNEMCLAQDFIPTFAAAAGEPDIVEKVKKGHKMGDRTFKVHLDGHNLIPFFNGKEKESPRKGFLYWSDDGDLMAIRVRNWKISFKEQRTNRTRCVAKADFTNLRASPRCTISAPIRSSAVRKVSSTTTGGWRTDPVPDVRGAGNRGEVAGELQGVSATPKTGQFQPWTR